jgi:hypothetical protein
MYDNVYESMECPPDEVIKDDDMLDGWFIQQHKDREKKLKEKSTDEKFGNMRDNYLSWPVVKMMWVKYII